MYQEYPLGPIEIRKCILSNNWEVVLFRDFGKWWRREYEIQITGFLAGPRYWFKPMEERIQMAKRKLTGIADEINAQDRKVMAQKNKLDSILYK